MPTPDIPRIKDAIGRTQEVFESLAARRGERYATKVATFVACDKMFLHAYQPSRLDHLGFCHSLMESMDIMTPQQQHDFVTDAVILRKAQEY
jgi:hypothetical protein